MLNGIDLLSLAGERMRYLTDRQSVISQNIANADTPGYQARDLTPFSFHSTLLRTGGGDMSGAAPLALVRTSTAHLVENSSTGAARVDTSAKSYSEKPDGNTVSVEEQMVKSADVANAFDLATTAYTKSIGLMKIGIDSGR